MSRRYLDNWEYRTASQLNMIAKEFEEPNRGYAFAYKEYLELNNRKARTIARRLGDLRFILRTLRFQRAILKMTINKNVKLYFNTSMITILEIIIAYLIERLSEF